MPGRPPTDYNRESSATGWFAGIIVALALLAIGYLVFSGSSAASVPAADPIAPYVKLSDAAGHGSGVHIGDGYIITAAHVAEDKLPMKAKLSDGTEVSATLLWENNTYDVALMRIAAPAAMLSLNLDCADLPVGADISAFGNPRDLDDISMSGKVAGVSRTIGPWKVAIPVDMTVIGGMSGGAVLDANLDVVGIVVGSMNMGQNALDSDTVSLGTAVPASAICMLLTRT